LLLAGCTLAILPAISVYIILDILPLAERIRMQSFECREAFSLLFSDKPAHPHVTNIHAPSPTNIDSYSPLNKRIY
jgi:hypothetical protein